MRVSYHILIIPEALNQIAQWQTACQQRQFRVHFASDLTTCVLNSEKCILQLSYKNRVAKINAYTSPSTDVTDICDDLRQYIDRDTQRLAINFDFDGEQENIYGVTIALLVLTHLLNGTLYIEGDGQIIMAEQALEKAKAIDTALSSSN